MKKIGRWKKMSGKKKIIVSFVLVVGVGLVALGCYSLKGMRGGRAIAREISAQETQAKIGTISDTIVGTGNLAYEEASSVTIPSGIVVDEVKVEAEDPVSKGDVLAVVNQASVLCAMEEVQAEIEALDEEIEDSQDDADSQSVESKVDGRVKKLYVQEGQEVSDCMAQQGALMLLSLDGYLAVEIETDAEIAKGDGVTLMRPDGTEKEGTVETVSDGKAVVLCSDSGVGIEENVTVTDSEGNTLGKGVTYVHSPLAVTATMGTVEEICVSEDEKVYVGDTLLKLESSGQSLEYQTQMAKRQELTESLQELIVLSKSGEITADSDGIIKSVNISADSSSSGTEDAQISQNGTSVVKSAQGVQDSEEKAADKTLLAVRIVDSGTANQSTLVLETPKTGQIPQAALHAEDGSYEGSITWKPECQSFAADTSYQAYVSLTAGEGYLFDSNSITQVKTGVLSGVSVEEDGTKLSFCITYPFTATEETNSGNENADGTETENGNKTGTETENGNKTGTGTENGNKTGTGTENGNKTGTEDGDRTGTDNGNSMGNGTATETENNAGNKTTAAGGSGTSAGTTESQTDSSTGTADSEYEVEAFTISSSGSMILSVNVDELDINSVSKGQQAEVTLDAIEDETFTGTVIKVGSSAGSSSGGVAKYEVELEIPGDERMKEGMNASATITIEERENVVTIPVNALQERGMKVFVYTQADDEGNLSGEKEVTTGLSDGESVEITEGLSEGDVVYYQKTGNISEQGNSHGFGGRESGFGGEMPGGDFPDGGNMPSDMPGNMPQGGKMPSGQQ